MSGVSQKAQVVISLSETKCGQALASASMTATGGALVIALSVLMVAFTGSASWAAWAACGSLSVGVVGAPDGLASLSSSTCESARSPERKREAMGRDGRSVPSRDGGPV